MYLHEPQIKLGPRLGLNLVKNIYTMGILIILVIILLSAVRASCPRSWLSLQYLARAVAYSIGYH